LATRGTGFSASALREARNAGPAGAGGGAELRTPTDTTGAGTTDEREAAGGDEADAGGEETATAPGRGTAAAAVGIGATGAAGATGAVELTATTGAGARLAGWAASSFQLGGRVEAVPDEGLESAALGE
jgi:hypothetical protein